MIAALLIMLAMVLFLGMFYSLFLSYNEIEAKRALAAIEPALEEVPELSDEPRPALADGGAESLTTQEIEQHLIRESKAADLFAASPSAQTLWLGFDSNVRAS